MAHSIYRCTYGWQVKLYDPSLTCAIPERLRGEFLSIKHYRNVLFTITANDVCLLNKTSDYEFLNFSVHNFSRMARQLFHSYFKV